MKWLLKKLTWYIEGVTLPRHLKMQLRINALDTEVANLDPRVRAQTEMIDQLRLQLVDLKSAVVYLSDMVDWMAANKANIVANVIPEDSKKHYGAEVVKLKTKRKATRG